MRSSRLMFMICVFLVACHQNHSDLPACNSNEIFTTLPVAETAILNVTALGGTNPPDHTVPSDHVGFYTNKINLEVVAPGKILITRIGKSTYTQSPFRQGESDYSIEFKVCEQLKGGLGHIKTLTSAILGNINFSGCTTYQTATETILSCSQNVSITLDANEKIGTVGSTYQNSFDFGLYDSRVNNNFINPSRFHSLTLTAVCPYDYFKSDLKAILLQKIGTGNTVSQEDPVCGGMQVDVQNTAQGVWVLENDPPTSQSNETNFATLRPDIYHMQTRSVLVFGLPALNPNSPMTFQNQSSGMINRPFSAVTNDNKLYCYTTELTQSTDSYLLNVSPDNKLTVELIHHPIGNSPCNQAASTWQFSSAAVKFIR